MSTTDGARTTSSGAAAEIVRGLMPALKSELCELVGIPSIAFPGYPREPLQEAHDLVVDLLREAGVERLETLSLPDTAPVITGEISAPPGAPTVLLYGHYDVVPPGELSRWSSPPFEATERAGAIFGRGAADSKSNVMAHVGALRAWEGRPPVGIKLVIEGQQEVGGGALADVPRQRPDLFAADAVLIMDRGSVKPGVPTLTVALRGTADIGLEVRTRAGRRQSGRPGGAAPDTTIVLVHALASLHDERGDVAVAGLRRGEWTGAGSTGPAITVTGIDAPALADAPQARARLNVQVHPEQPAAEAQAAVVAHLERVTPFGVPLSATAEHARDGFAAQTAGPAYQAARAAMSEAWGASAVMAAGGESIPLVTALHAAVPEAEILLLGATDGFANIHAPDERVIVEEFEHAIVAEAKFFREFATRSAASA